MNMIETAIREVSKLPEQKQRELLAMAKGMEAAIKIAERELCSK